MSILISSAIPSSFTSWNAFSCCSAYIGKVAIGTPNETLSKIEFHPQCETKPPTAGCDSTATCSAHPITFPIPLVLSRNPSGRTSSKDSYSVGGCLFDPFAPGFLNDHKNRAPLFSNAVAISLTWDSSKLPIVPKHKKTTDFSGCSSSQLLTSSSTLLYLYKFQTGPIG
ncbi:hypothetical protein MIMGU_mgv1a019797mg [Erythranthe guttata]|uniref:Uncharacterized protein n=1 Tax=Erythranthe guttata TaxID=4155 RepID=A0A022RSY4_ERYGU|nr:hypothetical protein MIMGU_mgv1a019797mg [Erythranthe guttata]